MVWDLWCFKDLEEKDYLLNYSVNELNTDVIVEQLGYTKSVKYLAVSNLCYYGFHLDSFCL